jgi:hypothetical protein
MVNFSDEFVKMLPGEVGARPVLASAEVSPSLATNVAAGKIADRTMTG